MNDVQEINVDELMAQIRENFPNQQRTPAVDTTTPLSNGLVAAELSSLQSSREIRYFHLTSHRKLLGSFVLLAKKVVRKLLTPSLERQSAYNAANIRLTAYLWEHAEASQKNSQELAQQIKELRRELIAQVREVRQELTEQAEQRYQELGEQIGGVHQEQGAALQAMRVELAERIADMQQEQAAAVQMIRRELTEQIGGLHRDQAAGLQALRGEVAAQMRETHQEQAAGLQVLRAQVVAEIEGVRQAHTMALQEMRERSSRAERRLRRCVAALTNGPNGGSPEVTKSLPLSKTVFEGNSGPYFDYFGFEERFRGSEEDIKERQRVYVEFFKEANEVLDIGCGRGEFLELMKEAGIKTKGVDLDLDMVLYCEEKGLDVVREDAYTYLESLADDSLGGLLAAQLVEHFEPIRISELVNLCHRKLQPGGVLIFETPNPICLTVFARSFYMDFSHIRPIHPEAMKFLFESAGFQNLEVKFTSPVEACMRIPPLSGIVADPQVTEEFNRGIERLNELLYGFQDYAVIGRKSTHS
jgi:2-polyprenyl-3-methyl-5-hydroxy-6-metoxy-1,4-benzoquinol methylase